MKNGNIHERPVTSENGHDRSRRRRTFWLTHQMAESSHKEIRSQTTLQELIFYLIFLVIFNIICLGTGGSSAFYMTDALKKSFLVYSRSMDGDPYYRYVPFLEVRTMEDFFDYMFNNFIDAAFLEFWYMTFEFDKYDPCKPYPYPGEELRYTGEDTHTNVLYQNKLLGKARLRQVRVRNDSCTVHDDFKQMFSTCYDYYSEETEDTEPFGVANETGWIYRSAEETGMYSYTGDISTYGGGGYIADIDVKNKWDLMRLFRGDLWIDRATRAVFVDLTIYNPNTNLFTVIKLVVELPPTGGLYTSTSFRTVNFMRYHSPYSFFILACEIIFSLYIIYFTLEEIRELIYFRYKYFTDIRTWLDLVLLTMSYTYIGFKVYTFNINPTELHNFFEHENEYARFDKIIYWQIQYDNLEALTLFGYWIKLFRFIGFNKTMSQLSLTLSRCAIDIAGFSVMFFIVFCGFALFGYLLFGTEIQRFSSFTTAMYSLLRIILSDFNYDELERGNPVIGPLYFITYVLFVFFILLNMFLAIINDAYSEVKSAVTITEEYEVTDFLQKGVKNILRKLNLKHKLPEKVADEKLSCDEMKNIFKKCKFSESEINTFFAKYNISSTDYLGEEHLKMMLTDMQVVELESDLIPENKVIMEDKLTMLERKQRKVEDLIQEAVHKADIILGRLSKIRQSSSVQN